ncbi:MAG: glycosyltransferase family 1 protein [Lachnospiraceae bacterium]|nr:glycosyltransferase family 1 protein [Lachnospiraceae bacterium]
MSTIRVLHMLHSMNRGGAETMIMNYYRNMERDKIQFDFLLTYEGKSDYEDEIIALGGRVFHIVPFSLKTVKKYCDDLEVFFHNHPEYKIVHSHNSSKSVFPLRIAKKCGIPVRIAHSHNVFVSSGISVKETVRKILRKPLLKYATQFWACSKDAGIWLYGQKMWDDGHVLVVKNAIDLQSFVYDTSKRDAMRKELGVENDFVVGHVGRFMEQKNHLQLISIFSEVAKMEENAKLLLVGDGPLVNKVKEKAKELEMLDKIIFTGVRTDVADLMQAMDVFVLPSLFEGLGIVLVEAQASGLPCFASDYVIPKEAKVTDLLTFVDLKEENILWANKIARVKNCSKQRIPKLEEIASKGYDIKTQTLELQEIYFGLL